MLLPFENREWLTHIHRDTYASFIGHPNLLQYASMASGDCTIRTKLVFLEKMLMPLTEKSALDASDPPYHPSYDQVSPTLSLSLSLSHPRSQQQQTTIDEGGGEEEMALD